MGFNTPSIIRFPFERILRENENASLIRINKDYPEPTAENAKRTLSFAEDVSLVIESLKKTC